MDQKHYRSQLSTLLLDETGCAEQLLSTLREEREALISRDPDALNKAANHKQAHMVELEKLEATRLSLQRTGAPETGHTFDEFLQWCDPEAKLEQKWADLLVIVEDCKKTNETNGAMVHTQHQQVQSALGLLCGISNDDTVYDASGNTHRDDPGRPLAKA